MGDPLFATHRGRIAELAVARRVPIVTGLSEYAEAGARRQDLKGARPAELPVEEPTTFELVVNLKTARPSASPSRARCSSAPTA